MNALALLASMLALTATAAGDDSLAGACAEADTSGPVPVCTRLPEGDLQLPEGTADQPLGALGRSRPELLTVDGRRLPLSEKVKTQVFDGLDYANTVYEGTVAGGEVTAVAPRLRVTEDAMLDHLFASRLLVGRISGRAKGGFKSGPRLPIVVELGRRSAHGRLKGVIRNATRAVRAAGACHPALSAAPDDPLHGHFTRHVDIERIPSMHVPFEDEMVLAWTRDSSGMGSQFYPSVATLFGRDRMGTTWRITQHGNPTSGPRLVLEAADGAVAPCKASG